MLGLCVCGALDLARLGALRAHAWLPAIREFDARGLEGARTALMVELLEDRSASIRVITFRETRATAARSLTLVLSAVRAIRA